MSINKILLAMALGLALTACTNQQQADEERHPPAPRLEVRTRRRRHDLHQERRQQQPQRDAQQNAGRRHQKRHAGALQQRDETRKTHHG